eukprot:1499325-Pyramimonas_sp.AAC.1
MLRALSAANGAHVRLELRVSEPCSRFRRSIPSATSGSPGIWSSMGEGTCAHKPTRTQTTFTMSHILLVPTPRKQKTKKEEGTSEENNNEWGLSGEGGA